MKKRSMLSVVLLTLGATVAMAAPAQAALMPECEAELPGTSTVYIGDGTINVNPAGPASDVAALRAWATYHVNCVRNSGVLDGVTCIAGLGTGGPYVYQDPNTGVYTIDYQAVFDHTGAIGNCLITD